MNLRPVWNGYATAARPSLAGVLLCVLWLACAPAAAQGSDWPARSVKFIVGYPAGGGADTVARLVANALTNRLGQQFVVENRAGAGGTIGALSVVRSTPDGYTAYVAASSEITIAPATVKQLAYDPETDLAPVALLGKWPYVLVTSSGGTATTLAELIEQVKKNPGKTSFSSFGNNTINHLTGELFNLKAGLDAVHVPYQGSAPSLVGLMGGQVQYTFDSPVAVMNLVRGGKLKALAVTSSERLPGADSIPTMAEAGLPGLLSHAWIGVLMPAKTPKAVVDRLNSEINAILKSPEFLQELKSRDILPGGGAPQDMAGVIHTEIGYWRGAAKQIGVVPK